MVHSPSPLSGEQVAAQSDAEMKLYDRLGPRTRRVIGAAHRVIDIKACLAAFLRTRVRGPDRWVDGDLIPSPPPPGVYTPQGDEEFAAWMADNVIRRDVGMSLNDLVIAPIRTGIVTKQAERMQRALGLRIK